MPLPPISKPPNWLAALAGAFGGLDTSVQRREVSKREDAKAALASMLANGQMANYASEDKLRQAQVGNFAEDNKRQGDAAKVAEAERRSKMVAPGQRLDAPTADLFDFAHIPTQPGFDAPKSTAPTPLRIPGISGGPAPALALPSAKLGDTFRTRQETPADVTASADLDSKRALTIKTARENTEANIKTGRIEKSRAAIDEAIALGKNIYDPEFSIARSDVGITGPPNEGVQPVVGADGKPTNVRTRDSYGREPFVKPDAGTSGSSMPVVTTNKTGKRDEAFLASLGPRGNLVKAIADGRAQFPQGASLRDPEVRKLMDEVVNYDPNFDSIDFNSRSKTRADFTSGKTADQIRSLNTAIGHLDQMDKAIDALNNGDVQLYNQIANSLKTAIGWTGATDYNTIAPRVAQEITRIWRGTGGSEADIQRDIDTLSSSGAPGQLHSSVGHLGGLIGSQMDSIADRYKQGMGISDIEVASPHVRETLDRLRGQAGGQVEEVPPQNPKPGQVWPSKKYGSMTWDGTHWVGGGE